METSANHIVEKAKRIFMRCGIKSVTMDDMSGNLGISKKTLYKFVNDKNDLVGKVMGCFCEQKREIIDEITKRDLNAIDENFEITRYISSELDQVHPSIHYDLEKYHPEVFNHFITSERKVIFECVVTNLKKGIAQGLYREDLNIPIIAKIYISRFDASFDGDLFPSDEFKFKDVHWEMFRYHIRGIASSKGIRYLEKKVKREFETQ